MRGLLEKDFRMISKRGTYFIAMAVLMIFLSFSMELSFFAVYIPLLASLFAITTISLDEFDNGMSFLMTLPVKAKDYAIEKYVLGTILGCLGSVIALVLTFVASTIKHEAVDYNGLMLMLPIFFTIMGIMFPIELKFGSEKSRIAMIIIFGVAFVATLLGKQLADYIGIDLTSIISKLDSISDNTMILTGLVINIVIFVISMFISIKIMNKKEY